LFFSGADGAPRQVRNLSSRAVEKQKENVPESRSFFKQVIPNRISAVWSRVGMWSYQKLR
jgi:hypothetical protein